ATASPRTRARPAATSRHSARRSSRTPGSGSRTRCSTPASWSRRSLPREDRGQPVDVHLVEDALAAGHLEARDELGAQDVDLAVEQAALVADLVLLLLEVVDQGLQLALRE